MIMLIVLSTALSVTLLVTLMLQAVPARSRAVKARQ